ncbi:uncharacterized protein KY384_000844 [Bacidia gigantensis]|uniref:uncharacterized protein n=1 Tax=Bacidia gigantensis TaxID=2732470 RepID=UPI001D04D817|nr:uncharacterized protein KY384_000844 [Bacidia gigantensis]KAG8534002.1 hypothetical protein KY384_000844 [Bacidia gigantensis]
MTSAPLLRRVLGDLSVNTVNTSPGAPMANKQSYGSGKKRSYQAMKDAESKLEHASERNVKQAHVGSQAMRVEKVTTPTINITMDSTASSTSTLKPTAEEEEELQNENRGAGTSPATSTRSSSSSTTTLQSPATASQWDDSYQSQHTEITQPELARSEPATPAVQRNVREIAEKLRLRLGLAAYRIRTNQEEVPFEELRVMREGETLLAPPPLVPAGPIDPQLVSPALPGASAGEEGREGRQGGPLMSLERSEGARAGAGAGDGEGEGEEIFKTPALPRLRRPRSGGDEESPSKRSKSGGVEARSKRNV